MRQRPWVAVLFPAVVAVLALVTPAQAVIIADGTLSENDLTLVQTAGDDPPTWDPVLTWSVDFDGSLWTYVYVLDTNATMGGISHMTVETSDIFNDIVGSCSTNGDSCTAALDGSSTDGEDLGDPPNNPDMNTGIFGLKLTPSADDTFMQTFTIVTDISPIWGDIFLKDGAPGGDWVNSGYFAVDPSIGSCAVSTANADAQGDCAYGFLAVPDSTAGTGGNGGNGNSGGSTEVPAPGALVLVGLALAAFAAARRGFRHLG